MSQTIIIEVGRTKRAAGGLSWFHDFYWGRTSN